jgi:hypothetical protein
MVYKAQVPVFSYVMALCHYISSRPRSWLRLSNQLGCGGHLLWRTICCHPRYASIGTVSRSRYPSVTVTLWMLKVLYHGCKSQYRAWIVELAGISFSRDYAFVDRVDQRLRKYTRNTSLLIFGNPTSHGYPFYPLGHATRPTALSR